MNKETRTFIWGLIVLLFGAIIVGDAVEYFELTFKVVIRFIIGIYMIYVGVNTVYKTIM